MYESHISVYKAIGTGESVEKIRCVSSALDGFGGYHAFCISNACLLYGRFVFLLAGVTVT